MRRGAGFIAAVATTGWILAFDAAIGFVTLTVPQVPWMGIAAHAASFDPLPVWLAIVPSLLLAPSFLCLVACLHEDAAPEHRHLTRMALAFAAVYTALVGLNYTVQLTVVRAGLMSGETEGLALWTMGNPHSIFWCLEVVGYSFMSIAGSFAAPALRSAWARWAFHLNTFLLIPATAAYVVTVNPYHPLVIVSLGAWGLLFPVATTLIARQFRTRT